MSRTEFEVSFDERHRIVRIKVAGVPTDEGIARYGETLVEIMRRAERLYGDRSKLCVMIDRTDHTIIPQNMATRLQEIGARELKAVGKMAVIVSSTIAKMQAERISQNRARIFLSVQDAEKWFAEKTD